jgi:hypothetical protein
MYQISETSTDNKINEKLLLSGLQNAADKKAQFLAAYPDMDCNTKPADIYSIWSIVTAYNSHRFDMFTIEEVWKSAKDLCIDQNIIDDFESEYEPMNGDVCALRSVWIKSIYIREHAIAKVVHSFCIAAKHWNFDHITWKKMRVYRAPETRFNPNSDTPLTHLLYVLRVIITFSIGLRNSLQDHDIFQYYPILEKVWLWCITKQPTLLALCSDKDMNIQNILDSISIFESAVLTEQWAFVNFIRAKKRFTNKDVDLQFVKEIRRDIILAHICLTSNSNDQEKYLWKDVQLENKIKCEQVFANVPKIALQPTNLLKKIAIAVVKADDIKLPRNINDPITSICSLVATKELLIALGDTLFISEPGLFQNNSSDWDLPVDMTMKELVQVHMNEDRKRVQFALGENNELSSRHEDPFEGSPFSIQTLKQLAVKGLKYNIV